MENYKKKIAKRRAWDVVAIIVIILVYASLTMFVPQSMRPDDELASFISGFQAGLGIAFIFFLIAEMVKISQALKDDEKLEEMYIEATDERKKKIRTEVESATSAIFLVLLLLGAIIGGYFNNMVFITLLSALIVFVGIKAVCKAYFNKKF